MKKGEEKEKVEKERGISYRAIIGALLLGLLIGMAAMYYWSKTQTVDEHDAKMVESEKSTVPVIRKSSNLTNPLLQYEDYQTFSAKDVQGLEEVLLDYTEGLRKAKKVGSVSVYYRDLINDHWIGIDEENTFSPSSLMKVPVMIAVLKLAEENPNILLAKRKYVGRQEHVHLGIDSKELTTTTTMVQGLEYTVDRLVEIMIVESDNEATTLLLDLLREEAPTLLEETQQTLGLRMKVGLGYTENFVSVKQYSSFFRTLYNASYLNREMSEKALAVLSRTGFGYGIRQAIPKSVVVCQKFGFKIMENQKCQLHQFGLIYHNKKPFLLGVMSEGDDYERLKESIAGVAQLVFEKVDQQTSIPDDPITKDIE